LKIVGGSMGSVVLDEAGIRALASMPSLDELRAKLIGTGQRPGDENRSGRYRTRREGRPCFRRLCGQGSLRDAFSSDDTILGFWTWCPAPPQFGVNHHG